MATCVDQRMIDVADGSTILSDDDEYTYEEYTEYEMVDESNSQTSYSKRRSSSVSVETVEVQDDDDDDEYTYEEESILEIVMEENEKEMESTNKAPLEADKLPPSMMKPPPPQSSNPIPANVETTPKATPNYSWWKLDSSDPPSPSQKRASNSAGLSELSKQLRVLQAKNESQNVDINRLERQLRILADLQGISVENLRRALEDACASEAFGELQHTVAKLRHELEAATLLKQAELRQDAAAPTIANLELKVGELEEVEEQQAMEIRNLYDKLRQETAKSTKFESENEQLRKAMQDMVSRAKTDTQKAAEREHNYQKQLQELRERQAKMMQEQASKSSSAKSVGKDNHVVSAEMAAEYEQMVKLLKQKDEELRQANAKLHADEIRRAQELKDTEEKNHEDHIAMKVKLDRLALTIKELEDADGQNGLRLAQFKARFAVQNERILDQTQQLDSLYTAFDLLKEEFDSGNDERAAMLKNLKDADEEIARQTKKMEESKNKRGHPPRHAKSPGFPSTPREASYPDYVSTSPVPTARPAIATLAPVSPQTPVSQRSIATPTPTRPVSYRPTSGSSRIQDSWNQDSAMTPSSVYNSTPTTYATARAYNPTPEKTPTTWDILKGRDNHNQNVRRFGFEDQDNQLICGSLIVESNGMLRKWKTRPSRIYLRGEGYQWDIGEKRSFPLRFGISKVEFHPNYPLSFAVSLDPTSPNAPTIRAATTNEHEYHRWMKALYKATTGEEYTGGGADASTEDHTITPAYSRASTSQEDQEDADLQRILELSKYET